MTAYSGQFSGSTSMRKTISSITLAAQQVVKPFSTNTYVGLIPGRPLFSTGRRCWMKGNHFHQYQIATFPMGIIPNLTFHWLIQQSKDFGNHKFGVLDMGCRNIVRKLGKCLRLGRIVMLPGVIRG